MAGRFVVEREVGRGGVGIVYRAHDQITDQPLWQVEGTGFFTATIERALSEGEIDIAQNVRVRVVRSTITTVLSKPDPAAAREAARDKEPAKADKA